MKNIRNIAIIAHVDHGKTTLVDQLLRYSGTFRENQAVEERVMDSMDLEREKGITIKAKNASFHWKDYMINIVDTPGHADFGGEVERIMQMVEGVLLVVDAWEGPQAQTRFVLRKALEAGVKPIVVINKVDRENANPNQVLDRVFDLFVELNANDEQLDFPIVYASGRDGYAVKEWKGQLTDEIRNAGMTALFETIVQKVPPPKVDDAAPFQMAVANLDYSDFLGRICYGKILGGRVNVGDPVVCIHRDGKRERSKVTAIFSYEGLKKVEIEHASAGNIVGLAGFEDVFIGETITDREDREALPFVEIDPPTIKMQFVVNDSPLAGKEGKFLTARHIKERLVREARTNVGIAIAETDTAGIFEVSARGEMQIAIIVEQMRREGYEVMVSRPEVIFQKDESGNRLEPLETLYVEVAQDYLGGVMQNLAARKGEIVNMTHQTNLVMLEAAIPTRGLIGFETDLLNLTKGTGVMSHLFREYAPYQGEIATRQNGVLVAMEAGVTTSYALDMLSERGILFVEPGEEVYAGMIVGQNARNEDIIVNPCKTKHLTNMRSQGDGKGVQLAPPLKMSLERSLEYIAPDEFVEATPTKLRLRKRILDHNKRKRAEQQAS